MQLDSKNPESWNFSCENEWHSQIALVEGKCNPVRNGEWRKQGPGYGEKEALMWSGSDRDSRK